MIHTANPGCTGKLLRVLARAYVGALLFVAAPAFGDDPVAQPDLDTCSQDDVASFAIRACSALITSSKFSAEDRAKLFTWRGKAWMTEDDPAAAVADFSSALEIDPLNILALKSRALAYTKLSEHSKAVEDWSRLIANDPKNEQLYRNRGASRLAAGHHADAIADFDKSLEISPSGIDAYIGRAAVYDALGERTKAANDFERAIAIKPDYLPIYWERAVMAERWGEPTTAIKDYETVLKINGVYSHARKALRRLGIEHPP